MVSKVRAFVVFGAVGATLLGGGFWAGVFPIDQIGKKKQAIVPATCDARAVREVTLRPRGDGAQADRIVIRRLDQPRTDIPEDVAEEGAFWKITQPDLGEADLLFMQRVVTSLCKIPTAKPIVDQDRAQLGLDNPSLELELADREPLKIQFGRALPERRVAVWVSRGNQLGAAFSIPDKFLEWLSSSPERMRNRKLLRMPLEGIDVVVLKRRDREVFALERAGAEWKLGVSGKDLGPTGPEAQKFINRLGTMQALEVRDQHAQTADCKKEASDFEVIFEGADRKQETLQFGLPRDISGDGAKRSAACSSSREGIFEVHPEIARYLEVEPQKLLR